MNEETPNSDSAPIEGFPSVTSLQMAAIDLHEMYLSLIWAGFTEQQALNIIGSGVAQGMLSAYNSRSRENKDYDLEDGYDPMDDEGDIF